MIYHVLAGDSLVGEFEKSGISGDVIVCREALIDGPIDAEDLGSFWNARAQFMLNEGGVDEIEYHEQVADELHRLTDLTAADEVSLWFEYELFCSVNMWFCLSLLHDTDAAVFRVAPVFLNFEARWDGFGQLDAEGLKACYELRTRFSDDESALGVRLWDAYRRKNYSSLRAEASREWPCFPYLSEVVAAAEEEDIRPLEVLRELRRGDERDFGELFAEFKSRAGVYGYGDRQVQKLLDQFA